MDECVFTQNHRTSRHRSQPVKTCKKENLPHRNRPKLMDSLPPPLLYPPLPTIKLLVSRGLNLETSIVHSC